MCCDVLLCVVLRCVVLYYACAGRDGGVVCVVSQCARPSKVDLTIENYLEANICAQNARLAGVRRLPRAVSNGRD